MSNKKLFTALGLIIAALVVIVLALYLWLLASSDPLQNPIAHLLPWPVACTTRGCVTTRSWAEHHDAQTTFAASTQSEVPGREEILTSAIRAHLLRHASLRSPVTEADARRYREEVLKIKSEELVQEAAGISGKEYDRLVLVPFLQQEALRQQHNVESTEELYRTLTAERPVVIPLFDLKWDNQAGSVVSE